MLFYWKIFEFKYNLQEFLLYFLAFDIRDSNTELIKALSCISLSSSNLPEEFRQECMINQRGKKS